VYAETSGSVAAPTAGLHFTPGVFKQLKAASISHDYVTLHVSAGTFKPVKAGTMAEHDMHAEFIDVNASVIEKLIAAIGNKLPVIAVGTTTLRTLESLYWIGVKILANENITSEHLSVHQWEPYESPANINVEDSLAAVLAYLNKNNLRSLLTKTSLLIAPSYRFKLVDVLITNFHQPRSTLLLLVAAFIGEDWKSVYTYALENDYRFLSYGDSCLLFR
jgi:S-adenosylmethionine:tRNA ribosyltransferase-isomerase